MPSVANIYNVDLSKYKLVKNGQFAFSGMQTGRDECIRIALYHGEKPIIISPAYTVFAVKENTVLPEYVMMWFSRKEMDRLGWFMSDSSIRTNLDLDRFYEMEIPIPYFLSGGISLENIHQLSTINHQPIALDINSKFEIEPGNKDLEKIKEFIKLLKVKYSM